MRTGGKGDEGVAFQRQPDREAAACGDPEEEQELHLHEEGPMLKAGKFGPRSGSSLASIVQIGILPADGHESVLERL